MTKNLIFPLILLFLTFNSSANVDWGSEAELPGNEICLERHGKQICLKDGDRKNIYNLSPSALEKSIERGARYALDYPVDVSELRLPKAAMDKFFESDSSSLIRRFVFKIAKSISKFHSFKDFFQWVGLHDYPTTMDEYGQNTIPNMGSLEEYPMGVSIFNKHHSSPSMTFSCAACHSANLFGTKILGMTNRFPRANETFVLGKKALLSSNRHLFKMMINPSEEDIQTYVTSRNAIKYVNVKSPLALGLDTSLAQVGLSLSLRNLDEIASKPRRPIPRANKLDKVPADSKPAVWWNLKYKTKWLSDASIDSGNPIHTNFLWNEIGRGVDLVKLENWLKNNKQKVEDLTAYVFNTEPPKFNDFFPRQIDIQKAKKGEQLFLKSCSGCHGVYEKRWDDITLSYEEKIKTKKVWYHKRTIVKNVGTDPYRAEGMKYFYKDLNRLKISKEIGTVVKPQRGYVPPPLVGIWARYPYFHNNSAPTLYDVITPETKRPTTYIAVPAEDKDLDFDLEKVGYPAPELIRKEYRRNRDYLFDTRKLGLSNKGHTEMLLNEDGSEKYNHSEKLSIIEFLKTL